MTDQEKVIKGLEYHFKESSIGKTYFGCPYCGDNPCEAQLIADAIALLKEPEEETTFVYDEYTLPMCKKCGFHPFAGYIPTIKWMKERGYMKCPKCGRTVKWND